MTSIDLDETSRLACLCYSHPHVTCSLPILGRVVCYRSESDEGIGFDTKKHTRRRTSSSINQH